MENITLNIYNGFTKESLVLLSMPFDKVEASFGYYSRLWKRARIEAANQFKVDKRLVRCRINRGPARSTKMVITLPSGASLSAPWDMNETDIRIIRLQMEAHKLAIA